MAGCAGSGDTLAWRNRWKVSDDPADSGGLYTIKDVAAACGLPAPVIMQLVPRTWTPEGWLYSRQQIAAAEDIAGKLRRERRQRLAMDGLAEDRVDNGGPVEDRCVGDAALCHAWMGDDCLCVGSSGQTL